jgi:flagellar hook assembly protein FlgD
MTPPRAGRPLASLLFAALVAAALLSLAVVQDARRVGVVVDMYSVERGFAPSADGGAKSARVRFRSRRAADGVTVRIVDGDGEVVRVLDSDVALTQRDRLYRFDWDGRTDTGGFAEPGSYRAEIVIPDGDREIESPQRIELREGDG